MLSICDDNIYDIALFLDNTAKNSFMRCNSNIYNIVYPMLNIAENGYECIYRSVHNSIDIYHVIKDDEHNIDTVYLFLISLSKYNLKNVKFFRKRLPITNLFEYFSDIFDVNILKYVLNESFTELHDMTVNLKIGYDDRHFEYEHGKLDQFFASMINEGNMKFMKECLRYHAYRNYFIRYDTLKKLFIKVEFIDFVSQYPDIIRRFKNDVRVIQLINLNATVDQFESIYDNQLSIRIFIEKVDCVRDEIFYYIVGKYPSSFNEKYNFTLNQFKFLYNLDQEVWGKMMNLNLIFKHSHMDIQFYNYLLSAGYDPRQYPMHIYWIINSGNLELIHQYILLCGNVKLDYKHSIFTYALCNTKCEKIRKILRQYATPQLLSSLDM
ncbi:hypothetical protein D3C87_1083920 [compost metagenome]